MLLQVFSASVIVDESSLIFLTYINTNGIYKNTGSNHEIWLIVSDGYDAACLKSTRTA